jgi:hypothetical protein
MWVAPGGAGGGGAEQPPGHWGYGWHLGRAPAGGGRGVHRCCRPPGFVATLRWSQAPLQPSPDPTSRCNHLLNSPPGCGNHPQVLPGTATNFTLSSRRRRRARQLLAASPLPTFLPATEPPADAVGTAFLPPCKQRAPCETASTVADWTNNGTEVRAAGRGPGLGYPGRRHAPARVAWAAGAWGLV